MKRIYIKNKKRLLTILLIFLSLQLGLTIEKIDQPINEINNEIEYFYIRADYGDTIWSLTEKYYDHIHKPENTDFRDLINIIIDLNGGPNINEGDQIKFPKDK